MKINKLNFQPLPGLASHHLQIVFSLFFPSGQAPFSKSWLVNLGEGDYLSCEVSIPSDWKSTDQTVVLVHGMGGSHSSSYMIRMSQKLYLKGNKVVRVNLRGTGSGRGLSKRLYHGGTSDDVLKVLHLLKKESPNSNIVLVGFSLGGNIILKLAGELGADAKKFVKMFIAVCAPVDLAQSVKNMQARHNRFYHQYFLKHIYKLSRRLDSRKFGSLYEYDEAITAPCWGYRGASHYYEECSSIRFLSKIEQPTHLLFASDDPFVSFDSLQEVDLSETVHLWVTAKGGHMGFLGKTSKEHSPFWMDHLLLNWIEEDFKSYLHF